MDVLLIEDSYFITKLVLKIRECDLNSTKAWGWLRGLRVANVQHSGNTKKQENLTTKARSHEEMHEEKSE